jgi:hypothetical protein
MEENTQMPLQCLFCFSTQFELPEEDYQPQPGEQIKCANCGRMNDYDSMMRVVQRKGMEWAEEQAQEMLDDFAKQIGNIFNN